MIRADSDMVQEVIRRTIELGRIPAPPLHEQRRAETVAAWWRDDGLAPTADEAGNVISRLRGGSGGAVVVCAHLDTVFDVDVPHEVRREPDRLIGPGVGDDTVAVAALATLDRLLPRHGPMPVWIAATVGEEGIGNLAGIRHLLREPPDELAAVIAIEGNYLGRVCTSGVGSRRWRVRFDGPGGHAWEAAEQPSAIHVAARAVGRIVGLEAQPGVATINVGRVGGGEAINARARTAWFELDVRATRPDVLSDLAERCRKELTVAASERVDVHTTEIGSRPAGGIDSHHPLVRAGVAALESVGRSADHRPASTDANAAYAHGLPAITVGVTTGQGEHTPDEYIDLPPLKDGLTALARTVCDYQEHRDGR